MHEVTNKSCIAFHFTNSFGLRLVHHIVFCDCTLLFYATADEADAYMFTDVFFVFVFFRSPQNTRQRSRERLNGFS